MSTERGSRKIRTGRVVSNKPDKTIIIAIERRVPHPVYHKIIKTTKKISVHDEKNEANINDTVKVMETRPLSKTKRWRLIEIVKRFEQA